LSLPAPISSTIPSIFRGIGFNPATSTEGRVYTKHILATKPDAKIGVLYQNDQLGKTFLAGVRDALGAEHAGMLVKEVSYEVTDPTVDSQVITLQGAGVDALIIAATSKPAAQTIRKVYDIGWTPERYLFFGAASIAGTLKCGSREVEGIDHCRIPQGSNRPDLAGRSRLQGMGGFRDEIHEPHGRSRRNGGLRIHDRRNDGSCSRAMRRRSVAENILRQAIAIKDLELPMLLPGVKINTSPDNYFLIRQMQLARFNGEMWEPFGELISG
jgi:branched-chain amino acid transport system substrate-binding protein